MTAKHFLAIAAILRRNRDADYTTLVEAFIFYLRGENPAFNPDLFRKAAGIGYLVEDV